MADNDSDEPTVPNLFGSGSDTDDGAASEDEKWSGGGGDRVSGDGAFEFVSSGALLSGLRNQGATCYLNSLLQSLYMTPELREGVYCLSAEQLGTEHQEEAEKLDDLVRRKKYTLDPAQIELRRVFIFPASEQMFSDPLTVQKRKLLPLQIAKLTYTPPYLPCPYDR